MITGRVDLAKFRETMQEQREAAQKPEGSLLCPLDSCNPSSASLEVWKEAT